MNVKISAAARTDPGKRTDNQDSVALDPRLGLYMVADGTGGRAGGQTAARLACEVIHEQVKATLPSLPAGDVKAAAKMFDAAVAAANQRIIADQKKNAELAGMATTVVLVLDHGGLAHLVHVGDSRVYLLRDRQLRQMTRDHSLANFLADNPQVKPEVERPGNTLVRALGLTAKDPQAEHQALRLQPDDVLLICTDGVSDSMSEQVIAAILHGASAGAMSSSDTAAALVRAALSHGTMDNVTAAVLLATEDTGKKTLIFADGAGGGSAGPKRRILGWLTFLEGEQQGRVVPLDRTTTIGADQGCAITITDQFASGAHAEVFESERGFSIRDLGSTNGTFVNNVRITHQALIDEDAVRIGGTVMVFKSYAARL